MKSNLKLAFSLLLPRHRYSLLILLLLMLLVAILESAGIGLLLPYIGVVNSPDVLKTNEYLNAIYKFFNFSSVRAFILISSGFLIFLFLVKNIIYVLQNYIQSKIVLEIQMNMESRLLAQYFRREYMFFTQKNPSELVQNMRLVSGVISLIFLPSLTALTEILVLGAIILLLLIVQPYLTLIVGVFSGVLLWSIFRVTKNRATRYGAESSENLVGMTKWMSQGFGGIKEVKILSKESFFLNQSMSYSRMATWSGMKAAMLSMVTRPLIETVWFSLTLVLIIIVISMGESGATLLPIIALLAAAAIRIMPALNRLLNASIAIRQATYYVETVAAELQNHLSDNHESTDTTQAMSFQRTIQFESIAFHFPDSNGPALHNLSFTIKKGQSVAFVGPSGAGKTTAVDLLLGLLEPKAGQILVDETPINSKDVRSWRKNFGYVPQNIYLSDDTIASNIAFGQMPAEIDFQRIDAVVEQAQLSDVLARLPLGLDTVVGDRGARLSGGQRQRIGIARALYRDPPILVLDEATSALDNETEREITRAIRELSGSKTVILIAHRLSTVVHCDQIVFLVDGSVRACGTYEELMQDCEDFRRFAIAAPT